MVDLGTLEKGADALANLGKPNQLQTTRRGFLKGAALTALGAAAVGCETPSTQPSLQFLKLDDGKLVITDKAEPVEVSYSTIPDPSIEKSSRNRITVRIGKPGLGGTELPGGLPETFLPKYAVRVFGDPYQGTHGSETVYDKSGNEKKGGYWLMLSDSSGNPADLSGNPLKPNQEKLFVAANFASVKGHSISPQITVNK